MSWRHRHELLQAAHEKSLINELDERLVIIRQLHFSFIEKAKDSGVSPIGLEAHIAEAMTKGQLPTVFERNASKTAGFRTLFFVDVLPRGVIPPEAIRLVPGANKINNYAPLQLEGPVLNNEGLPNVFPNYVGRYHITYTQLHSDGPVNERNSWIIDRMDAHIPDRFTSAGGDLLKLLENR